MEKPGFITGIKYFLRGFSLVNTAGIRHFVIIPLAINITLLIGALWFGIDYTSDWVKQLQTGISADSETGPQWLNHLISYLSWILIPLFILAFLAVTFYGFTLLANLIAAPFNSLLAEKIEGHLDGSTIPSTGNLLNTLKDTSGSFVSEGRKLLYFLLHAIPFIFLFGLGLIFPPVGFIATLLWFIFSSWMLAIEYSDYPMSNHAIRFPAQRQLLKKNRLFALGFGAAAITTTMIPIVNFFAMPVAIAGSTAMWTDYWKNNLPGTSAK